MAQLGTGETDSRSGPEQFCLFVILLLFKKGFKILATEYSEFLDSVHSEGENPIEDEYDNIRMFRNEPNPNGHL